MSATAVQLIAEFKLPRDVSKKARRFLFANDDLDSENHETQSISSIQETHRICPDTEKPENVNEWEDAPSDYQQEEEKEGWLSSCRVTSYSDADYFLASFGARFVLFSKSLSGEEYKIETMQKVEDEEHVISASCLLGLSNPRHSDQLDCVLVAVGTVNGFVHFYTEKGTLLFHEQFSSKEPICDVVFSQVKGSQVFLVVLRRVFFVVDVVSMYSTLLQAKSSIAKGEKTAHQLSESLDSNCELLDPEVTSDILHVVYTGPHTPTTLEQYMAASSRSFYARVERFTPPTYSTFAVTTEASFLSFVWHDHEAGGKIWNEAIKYGKSLLPSIGIRSFFGLQSKPLRKTPLSETACTAPVRNCVRDNRVAETVEGSPDGRYLAIVDRTARVVLVDVLNRQIAMIWKGYREASVFFVTSTEEKRVALFLAIYSPRRALLEVWTVESGFRIAAQLMDPKRLHVERRITNTDNEFQKIVVPFHLALVTGATYDQHDQLLLRKLQTAGLSTETFCEFSSVESVKSLGNFVDHLQKAIELYGKLLAPSTENSPELETTDINLKLKGAALEVVKIHLDRENITDVNVLSVGEWLSFIDWTSETTEVFSRSCGDGFYKQLAFTLFGNFLKTETNAKVFLHSVLNEVPFSKIDILKLLSLGFLSYSQGISRESLVRTSELLFLLEEDEPGALQQAARIAFEWTDVGRAILLFTACFLAKNFSEKPEESTWKDGIEDAEAGEATGENEDISEKHRDSWHSVNVDEHADSLIQYMHVVFLVQTLTKRTIPLVAVASHADSFLREKVASWAVREKVDAAFLTSVFPADMPEVLGEDQAPVIDIPESTEDLLRRIHELLPRTFEHDSIFADIAWEHMSTWFKEKSVNFSHFASSLENLDAIVNLRLRHGVARLIWDNFVSTVFKALSIMVDKTKRAPKERESRKDLGFSEDKTVEFLAHSQKLLSILLESVREAPMSSIRSQDVLQENAYVYLNRHLHSEKSTTKASNDSLVAIAMRQQLVNYHLVLHHLHLAVALRLQLSVGIRMQTIRTLFCAIGGRAFFTDLDSHPLIPLDRVDDSVLERRHSFLAKVAEQGSTEERKMAKMLAGEWNLTVNSIALMQSLSALRLGNDDVAAQELSAAVHDDHVAASLARILAARILQLGESSATTFTKSHMTYLMNMAGEELTRVECPEDTTWQKSIVSLGKIAVGCSFAAHAQVPFLRLNDIAKQYWAIYWTD
ncbi:unnamed protein product [Caenorhabditis auriculariae]|uniref:Rab3-GAP regulatory subunit N-terminal domain-containing protein n=1 Tax=Caenorhabditis auriculariae TaxID=2777116 RepID=A0A8S1HP93_9PELO|nr:unnamed protein product [Caenorhabditis auriculariae]